MRKNEVLTRQIKPYHIGLNIGDLFKLIIIFTIIKWYNNVKMLVFIDFLQGYISF